MSFPNLIYGKYGDEKVTSSTKITGMELGQRMVLPDGRMFAYAQANTAATIAVGLVCSQKAVSSTGHVVSVTGTAAVAATTIVVTLSATGAVTLNQFEEGYIQSYKTATAGYLHKVKSNNSAAVSSTCNFVLHPYDPLKAPMACSVYLRENEFKHVLARAAGSAVVGTPVGVAANSVVAGYYFWIQRRGPCSVLSAGTVGLVGEPATAATTVAGGVQRFVIAANTATACGEWEIGRFMVAPGATTDYAMVYLELD